MGPEVTCPQCGSSFEPYQAPAGDLLGHRLAEAISAGKDVDSATDAALADLPPHTVAYVRPAVRRQAAQQIRDRDRRVEKEVIGSEERWAAHNQVLRAKMLALTFSLGRGVSVTWGKATPEQHRQRIALLDEQSAGIADTKSRHLRAIKICEDAGVDCLEKVDDGEKVLEGMLDEDASAPVVAPSGVTARRSATSGNGRTRPAKAAKARPGGGS